MSTKAKEQATETETHNNDLEGAIFDAPVVVNPDRQQKRAQMLKAIRYQEYPRAKSRDLVGKKFDLVDAVRGRIKDDDVVTFIVRLGNDDFAVSKPINAFTESYLSYFETFDAGETVIPMTGYTFVEEGTEIAGNKPVILRKM